MREELERALRVSDLLISCHSVLRDRYARRALVLDVAVLAASVWLVAMAFVDPETAKIFSFPHVSATITIGLIAVLTFILSLFQLRTDWKFRSERYDQAVKSYTVSKFALRAALSQEPIDERECENALSNYQATGASVIAVPERQFNKLKKRHLLKIRISQMLDRSSGTSIVLIRIRLWLADSFNLLR